MNGKPVTLFAVLFACGGLAQAQNAYIEFSGVIRGNCDVASEAWRWMVDNNYAWKWFENCSFTATVSNVDFMQGKDHSKLV